jgi:hypothetical protein
MSLRSAFYFAARLLGDVNAIQNGTIVQRLVRKSILARVGALVNRIIR